MTNRSPGEQLPGHPKHHAVTPDAGPSTPAVPCAWLLSCKEAERYKLRLFMPPGHFYSPIIDVAAIAETMPRTRPAPPARLADVAIDIEAMTVFWTDTLAPILATSQTREQADGAHR